MNEWIIVGDTEVMTMKVCEWGIQVVVKHLKHLEHEEREMLMLKLMKQCSLCSITALSC